MVPAEKKDAIVLTDNEAIELAKYAEILEKHYGIPQDIEWGIENDKIYILQSRPITTINNAKKAEQAAAASGKVLFTGLGAAPGMASGIVRLIASGRELDKVKPGDIMVTKMTMPDMVPGMKRAGAIVTDEGGMACHAAIVSRELGCPAVVGSKKATTCPERRHGDHSRWRQRASSTRAAWPWQRLPSLHPQPVREVCSSLNQLRLQRSRSMSASRIEHRPRLPQWLTAWGCCESSI